MDVIERITLIVAVHQVQIMVLPGFPADEVLRTIQRNK